MKNLLIEGMPGCGKSTAILQSLKETGLLPYCAGYRTVRVFSSACLLRGFAQVPAAEETAVFPGPEAEAGTGGINRAEMETLPEVECMTDAPVPNLFLDFSAVPPLKTEVLLDFTVNSLRPAPETQCILIDEMGGRELEIPEVQEAYLKALKGPVPVIGVLKAPEHARHFALPAYEIFRKRIEETTDTEIFAMTADTRYEAGEHIRAWLQQCLQGSSDRM